MINTTTKILTRIGIIIIVMAVVFLLIPPVYLTRTYYGALLVFPLGWFVFCYYELQSLYTTKKNPVDFIVKSSIVLIAVGGVLVSGYLASCTGENCLGALRAGLYLTAFVVANIIIQYIMKKIIISRTDYL